MRRPAVAISLPTLLVTILAGLASAFVFLAPAADAGSYSPSSYASRLLSLVNQARQQNGLRPLSATSGTGSVAMSWTNHLAADRSLSHNPNLAHDLSTHGSSHWMAYGENVGQGSSSNPDALFNAYMNSPEHRDNILTRAYHYVGVAVVFTGRTSWNTFDFVDSYGSGSSTQPVQPVHHHHATVKKPVTKPAPSPAKVVVHRAPATPAVHHAPAAVAHHAPARPAFRHHVHVKGFQTRSPAPHPLQPATVTENLVTALPVSLPTGPTGSSHERAVVAALAVLALAGFGRRWVLAVS
jgi:hypothetical protein